MSFMTYVNQAKKVKSIVFVGWLRDALSDQDWRWNNESRGRLYFFSPLPHHEAGDHLMMAIEKEQRQKDFTGQVTVWCGLENVRSMEELRWIFMG